MSVYLLSLIKEVPIGQFIRIMLRAGVISFIVFFLFAWLGEVIFDDVLQVRFLAFMIFGGITFLVIGVRLILGIGPLMSCINPHSEEVAGAIAMPFIVGPGTISASVIAGTQLRLAKSSLAIALGLALALGSMFIFKKVHDYVKTRSERYVERYVEIAGRITALFTGSFAVDMILKGIERWIALI
jgi:multiple antibiotic resistance protein